MKRLRVFIVEPKTAGPMAYAQREKAAQIITAMGVEAMTSPETEVEWPRMLRVHLKLLLSCDAVLLLANFTKSSHARFEREVALRCGMPVFGSRTALKGWVLDAYRLPDMSLARMRDRVDELVTS